MSNTTHKPTGQVGFTITSKTVDANDDATLFDNARGSTNEGAPGGDRLQNALDVVFKSATDQGSDPNFYKLISVVDGVIQGITIPSPRLPTSPETGFGPVYASVADQLARRTREESGSYTVTPFVPKILDSLDDSERFEVSLSPGLAYVNGARIETLYDTHVTIPRQTDTTRITNYKVGVTGTPYLEVTNVNDGILPGLADSDANGPGDYANRLVLLDSDRNAIGYARSYAFQEHLGLVEAIATTAVPITPKLEKEILAKVATLTDKKVTLVNKVDPTIIGGFILRIDDVALNASVAHQLNSLKQTLRSNAISWQK